MLEIMLGLIALALIFALLYFFTPNDPNSITSGGLRMLLFFLSLWFILGISFLGFHYAVDGSFVTVNNTIVNATEFDDTNGTITVKIVPVVGSSIQTTSDVSSGQALLAYFQATLWGIIAIVGITLIGLLYMIFLMLKEMIKPKKKFENGPRGG